MSVLRDPFGPNAAHRCARNACGRALVLAFVALGCGGQTDAAERRDDAAREREAVPPLFDDRPELQTEGPCPCSAAGNVVELTFGGEAFTLRAANNRAFSLPCTSDKPIGIVRQVTRRYYRYGVAACEARSDEGACIELLPPAYDEDRPQPSLFRDRNGDTWLLEQIAMPEVDFQRPPPLEAPSSTFVGTFRAKARRAADASPATVDIEGRYDVCFALLGTKAF
jgi:hypothetical protein